MSEPKIEQDIESRLNAVWVSRPIFPFSWLWDWQQVERYGLRRRDIEQRVRAHLHRLGRPVKVKSARAPRRALFFRALAVLLFICILPAFFADKVIGEDFVAPTVWALAILGIFSFLHGARLLQPTAAELLAHDARAPVVLLRSFGDDSMMLRSGSGENEKFEDFEGALVLELRKVGPVIAVGRPGEKLPAIMIAMVPGTTGAVRWEIERVNHRRYHESLQNLTPADVYLGAVKPSCSNVKGSNERPSNSEDCTTSEKPPNLKQKPSQSLYSRKPQDSRKAFEDGHLWLSHIRSI